MTQSQPTTTALGGGWELRTSEGGVVDYLFFPRVKREFVINGDVADLLRALAGRVDALEAALRAAHDQMDDLNAAVAVAGALCYWCKAASFDAQNGIIHNRGCIILRVRAALTPQADAEGGRP